MRMVSDSKGSVSVEFALVLAFILIPLLAGLVDVGRLVHAHVVLERAAREGAVSIMRGETYATPVARVLQDAGLDTSSLTVSLSTTSDETGETKTLQLTYIIPNFPIFKLPGLPLSDNVTARAVYSQP